MMRCIALNNRPTIAVSSCLLGNPVRYDGQHKHHLKITTELNQIFNLIAFCPEADSGMGVPRPPIHLVLHNRNIRALGVNDLSSDFTKPLKEQVRAYHTDNPAVHGLLLQEKSPSCGYKSVNLYDLSGNIIHSQATGLFVATLLKEQPVLPILESSSLSNQQAVHNYIQQVNQYAGNLNR